MRLNLEAVFETTVIEFRVSSSHRKVHKSITQILEVANLFSRIDIYTRSDIIIRSHEFGWQV